MTIKEQSDLIVEKYRPYTYYFMGSGMLSNTYDEKVHTRNAVLCGITEVEARIEEVRKLSWVFLEWVGADLNTIVPGHMHELTAILNDLKSRI